MKKLILINVLLLIVSCTFAQQFDVKYDKKYYSGYILINDDPVSKNDKPNQKIECKIKNIQYFYYPTSDHSATFNCEYITPMVLVLHLFYWMIMKN